MYISVKPKKEFSKNPRCRVAGKVRKENLVYEGQINTREDYKANVPSVRLLWERLHDERKDACEWIRLMLMDCFSSWDRIKWQGLHCELMNWKFPASCRTMLSTQVINGSPSRKCRCLIIPRIESNSHSIMANPTTAKRLVIHEMMNIKSAPIAVP